VDEKMATKKKIGQSVVTVTIAAPNQGSNNNNNLTPHTTKTVTRTLRRRHLP